MSTVRTSIGTLLREGRLRQRLSIVECAKSTHISSRYLEALEEERWGDLPSESHRIGFLRLYARYLGVPAEEMVSLYQQTKTANPMDEKSAPSHTPEKATPPPSTMATPSSSSSKTADSISGPQMVLMTVVILILSWFTYHWVHQEKPGEQTTLWNSFHPRHSRLGASKTPLPLQQLRIHASDDSWLRIVNGQQLLYEGFLRAGSNKTWSGMGPFNIKVGNKQAITLFWNDQEVDLKPYAGAILELQLPLSETPR